MKDSHEKEKREFLARLAVNGGQIVKTCEDMKLNRMTLWNWRQRDPEFNNQVDDTRLDAVEDRLMSLATGGTDAGDVTACIFILKTKGRARGWNEKANYLDIKDEKAATQRTAAPRKDTDADPGATFVQDAEHRIDPKTRRRMRDVKARIIRIMKRAGRYDSLLDVQIERAAAQFVHVERIESEVLSRGHSPVRVEYSREGNERVTVDPLERLYIDAQQQLRRTLQSLGMNTDAKERDTQDDGVGGLLAQFSSAI